MIYDYKVVDQVNRKWNAQLEDVKAIGGRERRFLIGYKQLDLIVDLCKADKLMNFSIYLTRNC